MWFTVFIDRLQHMIFTSKCLFCNELLHYNEFVCDKCINEIVQLPEDRCCSCLEKDCVCLGKYYFSYLISPFIYEDKVKDAVIDMKFNGLGYNAKAFSKVIFKKLNKFKYKKEIDLVVEVPMYYTKRWHRGYNQSELIAKYLSDEMNLRYYKRIITKIKNTKEQNKLSYNLRVNNLKDCYKIFDSSKIKGKTVLLVDDVFTTGSTVNECSKVLLENGAKKVFVATCCVVKKE